MAWKIRVTENRFGHVELEPVSPRVQRLVSKSNQYNGSHTVYMQVDYEIWQFMDDFPRACFGRGGDRQINDGVVIHIDEWTYRHMVGGQSD